jgi:putative ABC transport system permease protein
MRRMFEIISSSFKLALQELWKNKLRTFLSLFGITIGIFCIIGVLATVRSLESNIQKEVKSLGTNTIYIDKWEWSGGGPDYPWWKFVKRPSPKYAELSEIKQRTPSAKFVAFKIQSSSNVEYAGSSLSGVTVYGVSEEFSSIQPVEINYGRYITEAEFGTGAPIAIIGNEVAEKIFGSAEVALGKQIETKGKKLYVGGVIKKQGNQIVGGWQLDEALITPYRFARTIMDEKGADPFIMVQGQDNLNSKILKDELRGTMRSIRKLSPTQEDNFALNDINDISNALSEAFVSVNIGGWAIAALSLIVGMFGVANIMFVTVKERTPQIGLKKALGAKSRMILAEFLTESAFLCIIGGAIGILLVFILTQIVTRALDFPIFISTSLMLLAIFICIAVGVIAGIIPASQAAKMDPVVAIRSH